MSGIDIGPHKKKPAGGTSPPAQTGAKCPSCGYDIGEYFAEWLHDLTGVSLDSLRNGNGLQEISWKMQIAERTLTIAGVEVKQTQISEQVLEYVDKLLKQRLSEEEKRRYEKELDDFKKTTEEQRNRMVEMQRSYDKLESEHLELKTRVMSNPALKGALAETELLEDIEACYTEQIKHLTDISRKGYGDILWDNIQIDAGSWTNSGISATIDSKDKGKISESDLVKLRRDMKFNKTIIGIIIAKRQDQLRMKETPCGIHRIEEGFVIITSRENSNYHIAIRFVRDVLARMFYETREIKERPIDTGRLAALLSDIMNSKEYRKRIRSKAEGIIRDVNEEEDYLNYKFEEAWQILNSKVIK